MRTNLFILLSAASLTLAAPTLAAETTQPQVQKAEQSKVVCRKETETGSILKKRRVCHTKREWEKAAQQSRDAMGQGQMSGSSSGQ